MDREWRWLSNSPADRNEFIELELPSAWEPLVSSRSLPLGEDKEARFGFSYGNQMQTK